MKLRIKGNSIRLRITRPELRKLRESGRIEESIHFAADEQSKLTYVLEHSSSVTGVTLRFAPPEIAVLLPAAAIPKWEESDQAGIYSKIDLGSNGQLEIAVEKDFACIDRDDPANADAFPNPKAGASCAHTR